MMLIKISWRNIWRNSARSLVIIVAIVLGVLGGNFSAAIRLGVERQNFRETVEHQVSHIQLHHPDFIANPEAHYRIEDGSKVAGDISELPEVAHVSPRIVFEGMAASANMNAGVRIKGVDPEAETAATDLGHLITDGSYFEETGRLPSVIIGKELAEELNTEVGSRIVLTFQDISGEMVSASFRIEGLYEVTSTAFEKRNLFVRKVDIEELIGKPEVITEIAVVLHDADTYREVAEHLQDSYPGTSVRHWADMQPSLYYSLEFLNQNLIWIVGLIILGVSFGLLNTILMSVLERVRELGILMAIGMKKTKVFGMIVLETTMLAIIGGVAGLGVSWGMIRYLNQRGMDISGFGGEGMGDFGYASVIHPELDPGFYLEVAVVIVAFAILAACYPAWKAIRFVPAEAVREE